MKMEMEKKFHSESGLDRISDLPESVRVHILSFLTTKEAVRTSILSSIWRSSSLSVLLPNLDLSSHYGTSPMDTYCCDGNDEASRAKRESIIRIREGFYAFLDRVFASSSKLDKMNLYVPGFGPELISRLDHWLDGAVRRGVKELALEIGARRGVRYRVPKNVLTANSIMKLKLQNCELSLISKMDALLPCLRKLSLEGVVFNVLFMGSLLGSCLNLESFNLKNCEGLEKLEITGLLKLEKVTVDLCYNELKAIKIDAPNLLKFKYDGDGGDYTCPIDLKGCENLKQLELISSRLDDSDLDGILENLPLLEKLFLQTCDNFAYVEIYNQNLVKLVCHECRELVNVRATTPNLKYFMYIGEDPISFVSKGPALKLFDASVHLKTGFGDQWFEKLVKLLAKLGHSENLTLELATEKDVIIPETVKAKCRAPLHAVKHLMVDFRLSRLKSPVEVVASLLWLAPCPESLTISNGDYSVRKLLKFSYEKPLKGKKKCGCWKSLPINCWRHSLKTLWIENIGTVKDDSKLVSFFEKNRIDGEVECFTKNVRSEY